jgi:hypothetical protein
VGGSGMGRLTRKQLDMIADWYNGAFVTTWTEDEEYNGYLDEGWKQWDGMTYKEVVAKKLARSMDMEMLKSLFL